jgi:hypothetical protein
LPILLELGPSAPTAITAHDFSAGGSTLASCVFDGSGYANADAQSQALGRNILLQRGAVVLIPRAPLKPGNTYRAAVTVNGAEYAWTFSAGSSAATAATVSPVKAPVRAPRQPPAAVPVRAPRSAPPQAAAKPQPAPAAAIVAEAPATPLPVVLDQLIPDVALEAPPPSRRGAATQPGLELSGLAALIPALGLLTAAAALLRRGSLRPAA